ncbi:hypothetical protein GC207_15810 [bacterium]|nr:hypothetical protein [bacterium]
MIDSLGARKTRPYEAVLGIPLGYLLIELSTPLVLGSKMLNEKDASILGEQNANVEMVLTNEAHTQQIKKFAELWNKSSTNSSVPGEFQKPNSRFQQIMSYAEDDSKFFVDRTNGLIVKRSTKGISTQISDFMFLDEPNPDYLKTSGDYKDVVSPPEFKDAHEWILLNHDPLYEVGGSPMPDGSYFNLASKELRRIPYWGFESSPWCFLQDRTQVIATGFSFAGAHELIKVDLRRGEYSRYRDPLLDRGFIGFGVLSPDGRTVAAIQQVADDHPLSMQMILLNVKTGSARTLGEPGMIGAPINWAPDGGALILKRFVRTDDPLAVEPRIICKLDLDGRFTDIKHGDWPIVLRKSRRLIYENPKSACWQICDLDGGNDQVFGDGLSGFDQPAVSPDEEEIIFRRSGNRGRPQLFLFKIGDAKGTEIPTGSGFFGQVVWR